MGLQIMLSSQLCDGPGFVRDKYEPCSQLLSRGYPSSLDTFLAHKSHLFASLDCHWIWNNVFWLLIRLNMLIRHSAIQEKGSFSNFSDGSYAQLDVPFARHILREKWIAYCDGRTPSQQASSKWCCLLLLLLLLLLRVFQYQQEGYLTSCRHAC